jgi:uncharacterized protein (TIGR02453 family)
MVSPGFTDGVFTFFEELEANNTREWFHAHKADYDRQVREPMEAVFAALAPRFGPSKLFRIQRDLRFTADKTPYKTSQAGTIDLGPRGVLYFQVSANGVMLGGGAPHLEGSQLTRYRDAVAGAPGVELSELIEQLATKSVVVGTLGEGGVTREGDLKRVPTGYPKDHPLGWLLKFKRIVATRGWDRPNWLVGGDPVGVIGDTWDQFVPLLDWLGEHVGATDSSRQASNGRGGRARG